MCRVRHIIVLLTILSISLAFPEATNGQDTTTEPLVTLTLGKIKGSTLTSRLGKPIFSFRGIRYAKAPVDELRFKVGSMKRAVINTNRNVLNKYFICYVNRL